MKRDRIARAKNDTEGGIDISSLIDICFLLLIYFIVTSTIVPAERDISVGVPDEGKPAEFDISPFLVTIEPSGLISSGEGYAKIQLDSNPSVRELPLLQESLEFYRQGTAAAGKECLVAIDAHDEATSQRVIDVLNALAGLGINKVTFVERDSE